jgi:predicted transcriptional regulator
MYNNSLLTLDRKDVVENTATIVASYVAQHQVETWMLPTVIRDVFETLSALEQDAAAEAAW